MDEVDVTVQECSTYINRQQFTESAVREKIEKMRTVGKREN